jgi:adenosylmethionine-8-amino-7-oxononanoate aminotransferase
MGALSATGTKRDRWKFEPLVPGFVHVPSYASFRHPDGEYRRRNAAAAEAFAESVEHEGPETIAAFVLEAVQGVGGVHVPTVEYLTYVAEVCRAHEILLILDEVVTGFGRTGRMFAAEHSGIAPDILTMSKGITSGYLPLGAVATTAEVYDAFWSDDRADAFLHGATSAGHPACCAVAIRNLEVLRRERLVERAAAAGDALLTALRDLASSHASIGDVRGCGLMIGIEFVDREAPPRAARPEFTQAITSGTRNGGVITRTLGTYANVIALMPHLCISDDEIARVVACLDRAIGEAEAC